MGLSLYLTDDEADAIGHTENCSSAVCAAIALDSARRALARRTEATGPWHLACCGHVAPEHYVTCRNYPAGAGGALAIDHPDDGPTSGPGPIRQHPGHGR